MDETEFLGRRVDEWKRTGTKHYRKTPIQNQCFWNEETKKV